MTDSPEVLLDDLEQCSVQLSEDLVAVLQLEADVVGLYPRYVLQHRRGRVNNNNEVRSW